MKITTKLFSSTLLSLLLLVVAAIAFFELVQPEYATLMVLKGKEASEQQFLANEQKLVTQAQSLLSSYQSQSPSAQAVNLAMPIGQNSAQAIAQLYGLATNSGLVIQSIGVSLQSAPQNSASTAASSASSLVTPKGSITFQVVSSGSYESLKTFLQGLESNVRIFDVTGISIRPMTSVTTSGVSQVSVQDFYNYTITAVAYYQSSS
jgi:Tfp pilus assembly protein PilO